MKYYILISTTVLWLATGLSAQAWGALGHEVIGLAVMENLPAATKQKVEEILQNSEIPEIKTIAQAAVWPDDIKPGHSLSETVAGKKINERFKHNGWWHYVNYPLHGVYTDNGKFSESYDIVHTINHCINVLEHQPGANDLSDVEALAFLVHLVGDLHQPLHVACGYYRTNAQDIATLVRSPSAALGLANDGGGNNLVWGNPGRFQSELHAFWDDDLVAANGSTTNTLLQKVTTNWTNVTLVAKPTDHHKWAEAWATDSIKLANQVYVDANQLQGHSAIDHSHGDELTITIAIDSTFVPDAYKAAHSGQARDQITKAARDLVDLLNTIEWP